MSTHHRPTARRARVLMALGVLLACLAPSIAAWSAPTARISGNGSSWAGNAIADWTAAVKAQGVTVDFTPDGSSSGRKNFAAGLSDFAVSEIPYTGDTADKQDSQKPSFGYGLLPVVAGGTSFMYNLPVGGKRYENLQLSQQALAKIFSGQVTTWNDPVIAATNPGVALPAQRITVVVRSDGSGATAQFTLWMLRQFPSDYAALCAKTTCDASAATSYYPYQGLSNFTAQSGSNGVTTYTANTPYTINYDEYSYALGVGFPVVKVQNAAGFYTVPTDSAVAVALTQAQINQDKNSLNYLAQDLSNVYAYKDPRTYPISAYSYLVVSTETHGNFTTDKGATLAYFGAFSLCEGQRTMGALGYSPLPMNLVLAAMDQVSRIPGIDADTQKTISDTKNGVRAGTSNPCNNPTFQPGDDPSHNILTDTAPFPDGCDATCQAPWRRADSPTKTSNGPGTSTTTGGNKGTKGTKGTTKKGNGTTDDGTDPTTTTTTTDGTTDPSVATGTDPSGTSPQGVPGSTDPGTTDPAAQSCDPDTGVCAGADGTVTTAAGGAVPPTTATVLAGQSVWGSAQAALVICLVAAALLILLPPLAARSLDRRRGSSGGRDGAAS
jgi:phosphate transport system substrate-binding protein